MRGFLPIFVLAALLSSWANQGFSQARTITGRVTDQADAAPLPGPAG